MRARTSKVGEARKTIWGQQRSEPKDHWSNRYGTFILPQGVGASQLLGMLGHCVLIRHKLQESGKRGCQLRNCLPQTGLWVNLWNFPLTDSWYERVQLPMGSAHQWAGHFSVVSAEGLASKFLPWVPSLYSVRWGKPFPPPSCFWSEFYHSNMKTSRITMFFLASLGQPPPRPG